MEFWNGGSDPTKTQKMWWDSLGSGPDADFPFGHTFALDATSATIPSYWICLCKVMKKIPTLWWIIGFVVVIIALFAWGNIAARSKEAARTNREVALLCTTDMATQFHIHPVLTILINGQKQTIPAEIGIKPTCMNSLHTHDASGTIHVESPEKRDFTLADFFAVWGTTFNKDQILDSTTDATHVIRVTVNGAEVTTYENTVLLDKDQITISYEQKK